VVTRRKQFGNFGERIAAHRLEARGMSIIARNVRLPGGEIDLVARDGRDLVFVEVRARRALPGAAAESLDDAKLQRMWDCAMAYCDRQSLDPEHIRVDVVAIDLDESGRVASFEHFRGIEIPGDE
jgi:putative endonuclease